MTPSIALAFFGAFLVTLAVGPRVIEAMRLLKYGQNINTDVPEHAKKQGTPTMGGLMIVAGVLAGVLAGWLGRTLQPVPSDSTLPCLPGALVAVLLVFLGHFGLGFLDDYLSIKRGKSLGLRARDKLLGQFVISALFVVWLHAVAVPGYTTAVHFGRWLNLGWGYYVVVFIWIMGISNATNLTDGLDGLLGGTAIFAAVGLALTVLPVGGPHNRLPWFGFALAGACLGFLWYNAHPARIFMGDTGSLAIGAGLAAMALAGKQEVLLLLFSIIFVIETVSVMIQVAVFKATGGRRVFKRTPIHHHFELCGWPETVVVARFWIVGAMALVAGVVVAPYI